MSGQGRFPGTMADGSEVFQCSAGDHYDRFLWDFSDHYDVTEKSIRHPKGHRHAVRAASAADPVRII